MERRLVRGGHASLDEYTRFVWNVVHPPAAEPEPDITVRLRRIAGGRKTRPPAVRVTETGRVQQKADDGEWMTIGRMDTIHPPELDPIKPPDD